jgi:hypothetical protein
MMSAVGLRESKIIAAERGKLSMLEVGIMHCKRGMKLVKTIGSDRPNIYKPFLNMWLVKELAHG